MVDKARQSLLAWLDLLRAANVIKKDIDARFQEAFAQSISRFDALAALERADCGALRAGALSRQLVVSEGNVTQLMSRLLRDGLVQRRDDERDGRIVIYALSDRGRRLFKRMARAHRRWIGDIFAGLSEAELTGLRELLRQLPEQARR